MAEFKPCVEALVREESAWPSMSVNIGNTYKEIGDGTDIEILIRSGLVSVDKKFTRPTTIDIKMNNDIYFRQKGVDRFSNHAVMNDFVCSLLNAVDRMPSSIGGYIDETGDGTDVPELYYSFDDIGPKPSPPRYFDHIRWHRHAEPYLRYVRGPYWGNYLSRNGPAGDRLDDLIASYQAFLERESPSADDLEYPPALIQLEGGGVFFQLTDSPFRSPGINILGMMGPSEFNDRAALWFWDWLKANDLLA